MASGRAGRETMLRRRIAAAVTAGCALVVAGCGGEPPAPPPAAVPLATAATTTTVAAATTTAAAAAMLEDFYRSLDGGDEPDPALSQPAESSSDPEPDPALSQPAESFSDLDADGVLGLGTAPAEAEDRPSVFAVPTVPAVPAGLAPPVVELPPEATPVVVVPPLHSTIPEMLAESRVLLDVDAADLLTDALRGVLPEEPFRLRILDEIVSHIAAAERAWAFNDDLNEVHARTVTALDTIRTSFADLTSVGFPNRSAHAEYLRTLDVVEWNLSDVAVALDPVGDGAAQALHRWDDHGLFWQSVLPPPFGPEPILVHGEPRPVPGLDGFYVRDFVVVYPSQDDEAQDDEAQDDGAQETGTSLEVAREIVHSLDSRLDVYVGAWSWDPERGTLDVRFRMWFFDGDVVRPWHRQDGYGIAAPPPGEDPPPPGQDAPGEDAAG